MKPRLYPLVMLILLLSSCRIAFPTPAPNNAEIEPDRTEPTAIQKSQATETAQQTPTREADWGSMPPSELFDLPWENNSLFLKSLKPKSKHWIADLPYASRYRIELTIPEAVDVLTGREEVLYTNTESQDLNEIIFRLFANINGGRIDINHLLVNNEPVESQLVNEDSTLAIPLKKPLSPGESILIRMDFALQIPREMGGNYGLFGFFSDVLMLDVFLPMIPAHEDGWYSERPSRNGDPSYNDASFYLVRVIAPQDFVLAASGVETERETDGGIQKATFAIGPARDFSLAGSRNFIMDSDTKNGVTVNCFGFAGMEDGMRLARESAQNAIQIFSKMIGSYDYTEFDVAATPMQAGGIEYPGMTWVNMDYFDLSASIKGVPASTMLESVTAHETGHQWFYNAVGNDQPDEPWLDESLTQYITGRYFLDLYGTGAYQGFTNALYARWEKAGLQTIPIGLPAGDYTETEYSAIVYGRGAFFFEELTEEMGADAFGDFLKDYYNRYHWKISHAEDMKAVAEEDCGCDLTDLFAEWVYP